MKKNSLQLWADEHPVENILSEWDIHNNTLSPSDIGAHSHKKVIWICEKGHQYEMSPADKLRGRGCPVCKSKKVIAGINDLTTTHPHIAKEWHPLLNDVNPTQILPQSNKKAWWICERGHEYKMRIAHRTSRCSNCPICSNKQVLEGYNDLATTHPEIASQWHPTKNNLTPQQVTIGSEKKVWWKCEKGHEWDAVVYSRQDRGCPYCSGNKVWIGFNDLVTTHPDIAKEWHPTKNNSLTPFDVTAGSNQKAWWMGKCGHEWEAVISSRTNGTNCPICNQGQKTSFNENAFYFYIKKAYCDAIQSYKPKWLQSMELDIYIPSLKIAIEYDGEKWHQDVQKDKIKNNLCAKNGVRLIRIREPKCPNINVECIVLKSLKSSDIEKALNLLFDNFLLCDKKIEIDISADRSAIFNNVYYKKITDSLSILFPDVAKEWHPTKNGNLTPENISAHSNKKVWWQCQNGHEWEDTCNHRVRPGSKCPVCLNRKVLVGFNDLLTVNPKLASQWHPTKNGTLTPKDVVAGSSKKVWWVCGLCGHEWYASITSRNRGNGCPSCSIERGIKTKMYKKASVRVGETKIMKCGLKCTIVRYKNSKDIDVEFEDGRVVKTNYQHFKNCSILPH